MKNSIKIIILTAVSLLILIAVLFSVLSIMDVYTLEESIDNFLKALYIILVIVAGFSLISFVTSLFSKN